MSLPALYIKLKEALVKPGCPVCRITREAGIRYLEGLLYEMVNDPGTREMLEASWGVCQAHARELANFTQYSLGIAILNEALLDKAIKLVRQTINIGLESCSPLIHNFLIRKRNPASAGTRMAAVLESTQPCPACRIEAETTGNVLHELNFQLAQRDPQITALYSKSSGLCWPHFRRALSLAEDPAGIRLLAQVQLEKMAALQSELKEFIRKHDYRYLGEPWGGEKDSWIRSLKMLSGWLLG